MQVLNQHSTKSTPHSGLVCIYLSAGPARAERKIQSFAPGIGSPRGFFRGLLLTNLPSLRYNQSLQGCPCIYGHLPSVNRQKMPSIGETLKEGIRNEADFPAEEASAQPRPWLFEAHVFQERPQGSGPPPCQGPQEPDRLIGFNTIQLRNKRRPLRSPVCLCYDNEHILQEFY